MLTPTLGYASGITPHLTKHLLDMQDPSTSLILATSTVPQGVTPQNAQGSLDVANLAGEVHVFAGTNGSQAAQQKQQKLPGSQTPQHHQHSSPAMSQMQSSLWIWMTRLQTQLETASFS
jgi:hypothetical protein